MWAWTSSMSACQLRSCCQASLLSGICQSQASQASSTNWVAVLLTSSLSLTKEQKKKVNLHVLAAQSEVCDVN